MILFYKVEISPLWQQKKIREFCEEKGIHVTAYSPLGAKGMLWGTNNVMECQVLKEIAAARGKSMAQVYIHTYIHTYIHPHVSVFTN
jgi:diketogulonate reductase-like aldo/keto reductase